MLPPKQITGLVKLHRSAGHLAERQLWAERSRSQRDGPMAARGVMSATYQAHAEISAHILRNFCVA